MRIRFFLEITTALAVAGSALAEPIQTAKTPVVLHRSGATEMSWESLNDARTATRILFSDIEINGSDAVDLSLEPFDALTPGARIHIAEQDGVRSIAPDVLLLRGLVVGDDDSTVFVGVTPGGVNGFIRTTESMHYISGGGLRDVAIIASDQVASLPPAPLAGFCSVNSEFNPPIGPQLGYDPGDIRSGPARGGDDPPCRVVHIAIDADWSFTQTFGGDFNASSAYAITLIAAVSEIYARDFNARLEVSHMQLWDAATDPYAATDTVGRYYEVQAEWNANMPVAPRDYTIAMSSTFMGGAGGGIAKFEGLCNLDEGYAICANLGGSFPTPVEHNNINNWDLIVIGHELGHGFGAPHTHEYAPPIDGCGLGDCSQSIGTLMSYCHGCPGSFANFRMEFHPTVIQTVLGYLDTLACDVSGLATAIDDAGTTTRNMSITIEALSNDLETPCQTPAIDTWDGMSALGGDVTLSAPGVLGYAPPTDTTGIDSFAYTLVGGSTGNVTVTIKPCPSDLNTDGVVDTADLGILLSAFGTSDPLADINGDGVVDTADLGILLSAFGMDCV